MIGKVIEVRGSAYGAGSNCWGQLGEIQIYLAREIRQVPSVQFAAGTRVWVPPPVFVPPPRPPRTPAELEADKAESVRAAGTSAYGQVQLRAKSRLSDACVAQHEKAIAASPGNREAIDKEYFACQQSVNARARSEAERASVCAQELVTADPDSFRRDLDGTWQAIYDCAEAPASGPAPAPTPTPAVAPVPAQPAPAPTGATAPAPTTTSGADAAAARAKALQEQQRAAQEKLAAQQKSAQEAKQRAQACMQELFKAYPDSGRSDPAGFQKGLLACAQAQQAQPAAK